MLKVALPIWGPQLLATCTGRHRGTVPAATIRAEVEPIVPTYHPMHESASLFQSKPCW